ncbi:MAG: hypothetical protein ABIQ57_02665 [Candidatus Kapaibacterium sp.]
MMKKLGILVTGVLLLIACSTSRAQIAGCETPCNLVKNGNFSAGNTGFTSDLLMGCNSCTAGTFCVGPQFTTKCNSWPANSYDHTLGTASGNYLLIDGYNGTGYKDVWKKSLPVCKGITYTFSFWAKNVYDGSVDVGMMINGVQVGASASVATKTWKQYSVTWTSAVSATIPIALRQMTGGEKRDFGVDDIFFGFCACACTPQ